MVLSRFLCGNLKKRSLTLLIFLSEPNTLSIFFKSYLLSKNQFFKQKIYTIYLINTQIQNCKKHNFNRNSQNYTVLFILRFSSTSTVAHLGKQKKVACTCKTMAAATTMTVKRDDSCQNANDCECKIIKSMNKIKQKGY